MTSLSLADVHKEWMLDHFWRDFCPVLRIDDFDFRQSVESFAVDAATSETLVKLVVKEGYFQLPPQDWQLPLDAMAALVGKLEQEQIPTPFAFIFDEFWALGVKLTNLLEPILGPGFLRLPDFWVWHVDPAKDERGWRPHRDKGFGALRPDRSPKSMTAWLPLTDATTLNGCMYLLPADRDPTYGTAEDGQWRIDLPEIRALPAERGSILMWNQAILHWGSHGTTRETRPRISVAFEFQACDVPPYNQPLMNPQDFPSFAERLRLIAKQILQYQHMYPLRDDVRVFAEAVVSGQGGPERSV